jgi:DNA-binding CsgD family transcriptional regulator
MLMSGDPAGMPMVDEGLEIAVRAGDDGNASLLLCNAGSSLGELRRYGEAIEMLERCIDFCRDRDLDLSRDYATSWLARVHLERGGWADAEAAARSLSDSPSQLGRLGATTVLGRLAVRRGGTPDLLHQAWAQASTLDETQRRWPVAAGLAESATLAGAPLPDVVAATFDGAVGTPMPWAIGELGWHLVDAGLLAADDERLADSAAPYAAMQRGAWIEAAELWDDLGCPYEAAVARARSDRPAAVTQALRTFDDLGARPDGDRTAARLRALSVPVPRRPRQQGQPHGLTTRESEVLGLLREGRTDREIAERLFISVKTAGHHVSSILGKLGVSSRRDVVP